MSPFRLLVLAILCYIAYRLIVGNGKFFGKNANKSSTSPSKEPPLSDILQEDPVCKKLVPQKEAVQAAINGKVYYFCGEECCRTFRAKQGEQK